MTLTEKIKSFYSGWTNLDFDDFVKIFTLIFLPFTAIATFIHLQFRMATKVVNTCSNTSISLIGIAPVEIANLIFSLWFGMVIALILSVLLFIAKEIVGAVGELFGVNDPPKEKEENFNYVIPNTTSRLTRLGRVIRYYAKKVLYTSLIHPGLICMEGYLLLVVFGLLGWFLPIDTCLNTEGKQLAKLGDLFALLFLGVGAIYLIAKLDIYNNIVKKLPANVFKSLSDFWFYIDIIVDFEKETRYDLFKDPIENVCKKYDDLIITTCPTYASVSNQTNTWAIRLNQDNINLSSFSYHKDGCKQVYIKYDKFDDIAHIINSVAILFESMIKEDLGPSNKKAIDSINEPEYSNPHTEDNNS